MDINLLTAAETESLRSLILSSDNIILCCHRSPDGDALGSLLGMAEFLRQQGKVPVAVVPDAYPDFLQWLPGTERIIRYDKHKKLCRRTFGFGRSCVLSRLQHLLTYRRHG